MLTRWGSILKVTHSEVTKGRRVVVNGIPLSSLSPSVQKRVWIAVHADFKWTVVECRLRLVCDIRLRECRSSVRFSLPL